MAQRCDLLPLSDRPKIKEIFLPRADVTLLGPVSPHIDVAASGVGFGPLACVDTRIALVNSMKKYHLQTQPLLAVITCLTALFHMQWIES
jgi:hypothetical protein